MISSFSGIIDEHLSCFQFGVRVLLCAFFGGQMHPFLLGLCQGMYLFGHMIDTCLVLVDATPKFSKTVVQITTPATSEYQSPLHAL